MDKAIALIVTAILAVIAPTFIRTVTETEKVDTVTILPCPTEDSNNCYWDADTMGENPGGTSFVTINDVTYLFGK